MNFLAEIINSSHFLMFGIFVILLLILLAVLGRFGMISFKGHSLSIGRDKDSIAHKERLILMKEYNYSKEFVDNMKHEFLSSISHSLDRFPLEIMFHKIYERIAMWLLVNNINDTKLFVDCKNSELSLIARNDLSRMLADEETQNKMESLIVEKIPELLKDLMRMREQEMKL